MSVIDKLRDDLESTPFQGAVFVDKPDLRALLAVVEAARGAADDLQGYIEDDEQNPRIIRDGTERAALDALRAALAAVEDAP